MTCMFSTDSPDAILFSLWLHLTEHFGWLIEHSSLMWGDIVLKTPSMSDPFLIYKPQNGEVQSLDPLYANPGKKLSTDYHK